MKYSPKDLTFLTSENFSASQTFPLRGDGWELGERTAVLERMASGRDIIHVGCLDHLPLIEQRIKAGTWLHKRLTEVSRTCVGLDIDPEGVELVHRLGFSNVLCCDLVRDPPHPAIIAHHWDCLILGEVLEHIGNPVEFLSSIREKYAGYVDRVILTVPNAFHLDNFTRTFRHIEQINTDHCFWFTPFTLAKVAYAAGLHVKGYSLCLHKPNVPWRRFVYRTLLRVFPLLRGTVVMELGFEAPKH